ncbi:Aldo/keto reductase [Rickenella mellea]|uniref:Aldo/keto reductase n=1 Tax=Rickenella mellea TaxID=50990 RepID=A0A4Y7PUF7_9AGAM|nr:Aldo/keto reductase [Rickenella mellea]
MPWDAVSLNDGTVMPSIAFGTWKIGNGQGPIDQVEQALSVGFEHVDTAQAYGNEAEAGQALKESGLARDEIFVTTKYSGRDGLDIETSIHNSLKNLGLKYVDLYLIHHPRLAVPDIPTAWAQMEKIKADGLVKTIGVSNFEVKDLAILLAHAKVKPVVNQILLHPYVYARQIPILEYCKANDIVVEAYSSLIPITQLPGGAVDKPVNQIAARLGAKPEQILMAWAKAKGAVVVTTSSKKERLQGYIAAGDLQLTPKDILDIDVAGAVGAHRLTAKTVLRRVAGLALITAGVLALCSYSGVDVI